MTAALESSILAKVIAVIQGMVRLRNRQLTVAFDIEFPLEVIATFRSLVDVVSYLSRRYVPEAAEFAGELAQEDAV